jgi:hypothetical protein
VEAEWAKRRSGKLKDIDAIAWLDYRRKLTKQHAEAEFRVVYATSGTHVCACSVSLESALAPGSRNLGAQGLIVDYTTYSLETPRAEESRFLTSVLNAPVVDAAIKAGQAGGLWGARHVCKKVLDLPIPKFDAGAKDHMLLVEMGERCADRVERWIASGGPGTTKSAGILRRRVREMLEDELAEIDNIVGPMLGL